ncbi:hypothetical protein [Methanobrevibacter millerae]|uniref:Uncharacterized protein n=1 Tax=Methanobrevibacter millerae TaxID=230361 RepID=A0A1G5WJ32_9EURY|nr:hypothetical protein [Methanobrevibacter millerae]SDA57934.1 hypothetical protein SAMN02910315_01450 [Methanobrevibacter millerae]
MQINIRKTIQTTVTVADEFLFYVEELDASGEMPTLLGLADEKYTFDGMDDEFFEFVERKMNESGIYVRLIHVVEKSCAGSTVTFEVESGLAKSAVVFENPDLGEVTDIGIRIHGNNVTLGTTVYNPRPHFESLAGHVLLEEIARDMIKDLIFYD